jgi:uncharacterized protein YecE (DUF72 family)
MQIRLGCSGWSYESWRDGVFYPPRLASGNRLRHYATRFDTVELNASFYRLPARAAAQHWAEQTSDDFRFAVKVSRYLTHTVRLNDTARHLGLLLQRIEPLRGKLGPLLWQLPPTFKRDDDRLAWALDELPAQLRHAFEFRHPSWFVDLGPLQNDRLTADFVYVRFHHGSRGRRGNYSPSELEGWAARIRRWAREREVWAYFNNDWEGFAPANAQALATRVSSSSRATSRSRMRPSRASLRAVPSRSRNTAAG